MSNTSANRKPRIVCLCGSTRFRDAFVETNRRLTLEGLIVLAPGVFGWSGDLSEADCTTSNVKKTLDTLHFRKIDLADEVLVVNPGGYVGESTRNEIAYAESVGVPVSYLEPVIASAYLDEEGWVLFDTNGNPADWPENWPEGMTSADLMARGVRVANRGETPRHSSRDLNVRAEKHDSKWVVVLCVPEDQRERLAPSGLWDGKPIADCRNEWYAKNLEYTWNHTYGPPACVPHSS